MGEVAVGDQLLGADGRPTTVVAATEVLTGRPCYEVRVLRRRGDRRRRRAPVADRDPGQPRVRPGARPSATTATATSETFAAVRTTAEIAGTSALRTDGRAAQPLA